MQLHELVGLVVDPAIGQIVRDEEMDLLVGEAGGGEDGREPLEPPGTAPGFLLELALGTVLRRFAGIESASGDLPDEAIGSVPELTDQQDPRIARADVVEEGDHGGGSGMAQDLELAGRPVGKFYRVEIETHDAPGVQPLR